MDGSQVRLLTREGRVIHCEWLPCGIRWLTPLAR